MTCRTLTFVKPSFLAIGVVAACSSSAPPPDCPGKNADCRASCAYGAGDLATLTLGDFTRVGKRIPIDHIVLVMQENRTFDHYFSSLTVPGQTLDGAAPDATNPDPTNPGGTIARFHQAEYCFDNPAESWNQIHREINGGKLDGFTTENALDDPTGDPTGRRAMGYYDESDLPYYYALARAFAISDRHFSSAQANTWTNRSFYMAGTAFGITSNVMPPQKAELGFTPPNLFTQLNDAKVTWNFYVDDFATLAILGDTWAQNISHVQPFNQFFEDAAAGQLASVTFVEGSDMKGGLSPDEDPPADMQVGQAMVAKVIAATASAPTWPSTALFLSYDEPGGLYDHVPPPSACVPDDYAPQLAPGDVHAAYDQYGLRVPLIVVSPYAKRGYVSHNVTDHTSLLRFIEARFDLPALTHRDANAVPPFDMFDFDHPDPTMPALPPATIDEPNRAVCAAR
jgi:phospholipase C